MWTPVTRSWRRWSCATASTFDGAVFAAWVDAQSDLSPKWRPRYVRLSRRAAHHPHQQGPRPDARAPEVPRRPRRRRSRLRAGPGRGQPTGSSGPTRAALHDAFGRSRARPGLGLVGSRWTCRSPTTEQRFAARRCGRGSTANVEPAGHRRSGRGRGLGPRLAGQAGRRRLGRDQLARRRTAGGVPRPSRWRIFNPSTPAAAQPNSSTGWGSTWPAPPCWPTGHRPSACAGCRPS